MQTGVAALLFLLRLRLLLRLVLDPVLLARLCFACAALLLAVLELLTAGLQRFRELLCAREIGRASCRERV